MAEIIGAGLVVYRKRGDVLEFLLLQATKKMHWTPPKGHVEPGEELMETAYRETKEEAGLTCDQLRLTDFKVVLKYITKQKQKEVTYWLAEYIGTNPNPVVLSHEHKDFKWATLDDALTFVDHENTRNMLSQCQDYLLSQQY
ncbi:bis(5'-nucleosyl)-tetraphosphatase [asymmetrical]-like [Cimex lectularius]|uniref:Bis(5'-nucleosyl)-tetraphosphatase [asymmetrical] n=1 Tax=Cimex lectularius TaxID=79782 RepID=A0A8I6RC41_CIMLE|nr:bis(5'-nucleosyl)-tetraphosphatase [asymmetrical]-like [Cimex lectularius]